jgi:hypothetical protein
VLLGVDPATRVSIAPGDAEALDTAVAVPDSVVKPPLELDLPLEIEGPEAGVPLEIDVPLGVE